MTNNQTSLFGETIKTEAHTPSYYNTTKLVGTELAEAQEESKRQEAVVLQYFHKTLPHAFAPHQIWRDLFKESTLLTNVRRCCTNLMNAGKLIKLGKEFQIIGAYGKKVYLYKLNN